jgi:hypothetical protein
MHFTRFCLFANALCVFIYLHSEPVYLPLLWAQKQLKRYFSLIKEAVTASSCVTSWRGLRHRPS